MIATKNRVEPFPRARKVGLGGRRPQSKQYGGTDMFIDFPQINDLLGTNYLRTDVPQYPFRLWAEDMVQLHALGHFTILMSPKTGGDMDMTLKHLQFQFRNKLGSGKLFHDYTVYEKQEVWFDPDWCAKERFFMEQTPKFERRIVAPAIIPGSADEDYFVQTEMIEDFLLGKVYKNINKLPLAYADAVQEFRSRKKDLAKMIKLVDWDVCSQHYVNLKLNRIFRMTPVETAFCVIIYQMLNGKCILENTAHATSVRPSYGDIVSIGGFNQDGGLIVHDKPSKKDACTGVLFSQPVDPDSLILDI
ncbi:MAG: hypothetical protein JWO73_217 [Candidatus Taylorbacteria bacterium]|nr:hypothetical protein [Candidatus Taylorbacteria bacterium]